MAGFVAAQVMDDRRGTERALDRVAQLEAELTEGRLIACDLLAEVVRLTADPRGLDARLIERARAWVGDEA